MLYTPLDNAKSGKTLYKGMEFNAKYVDYQWVEIFGLQKCGVTNPLTRRKN
jgi:hypothetical protein